MKIDINQWLFQIPLKDVQSTSEDTTLNNVCLLCGKKVPKPRYYVHLLNNSNLISTNSENIDISQGFFTIGTECRKRLPNNFYFDTNLFANKKEGII
jgi:hypothetical protein